MESYGESRHQGNRWYDEEQYNLIHNIGIVLIIHRIDWIQSEFYVVFYYYL